MIDTTNMTLLKHDGSNWDLYIDDAGWIWYVATPEAAAAGCKSGYWGNAKHFYKMFGEKIPA
jgi:hypothetical protein